MSTRPEKIEVLVWCDLPRSPAFMDRFDAYVMSPIADECLDYGELAPYGCSITYVPSEEPFETDGELIYVRR